MIIIRCLAFLALGPLHRSRGFSLHLRAPFAPHHSAASRRLRAPTNRNLPPWHPPRTPRVRCSPWGIRPWWIGQETSKRLTQRRTKATRCTSGEKWGGGNYLPLLLPGFTPAVESNNVESQLFWNPGHALALRRPNPPSHISSDLAVMTHRPALSSPLVGEKLRVERHQLPF